MADEKKTYLINVESNLKKYAEEAAEAKKRVDELKLANEELKKSGTATTAEIEASSAALRNAQKEYNQAKKMVDIQTAANKSEVGSRKQLGEILKLQEQALGKLGSAYIKDAQGIRILNPLYVEQRKRIAETKQAIIDYDQSLNDGRSNIGRYSESVGIAFADVGKKMTAMLGPVALVGAAITGAKKLFEGLKEAMMSTTFAMDMMNKVGAVTKQFYYDLAITGKINIGNLIGASKIQGELNKLRVEEGFNVLELSKINREEQAIRERSIDRTRTHTQRLEDLNKITELESEKTKIKVGHLQAELKAKQDLLVQQPANEKLALDILAIAAKINDTYAEEDQAMRRVNTQRTGFMQEEIDNRKKMYAVWMKEIEDMNIQTQKDFDESKKVIDDFNKYSNKIDQDRLKENEKIGVQEIERLAKTHLEKQKLKAKDVEEEEAWQQLIDEVDEEIYLKDKERSKDLLDFKVQSASMAFGALSQLVGENTEAGKAFAIAQATIDTWAAANKALAAGPPPWNFIMMGAVIAEGLANIAKIVSVNTKSKSTTSKPSSIVSAPVTQRAFATPSGASVLTQPQLSQAQLNALPNQNLLTAADIVRAMANMPAPIVTVEDINAKVRSVNKISVRANI